MAKKSTKQGSSKSQAIREYKASHPEAGPKAIADALAATGVQASAGFVSTILWKLNQGGDRTATETKNTPSDAAPVELKTLLQAKKLAERLGGIGEAKQALDVLAKLLG